MKNIYTYLLTCLISSIVLGQQKIRVHNSGNTMYTKEISSIDSIKLDNTYAKFKLNGITNTLNLQKTVIDSLTFTNSTVTLDKIYIIYNGSDDATIINPYANAGVTITATAGTVVVTATSGISNLEYNILGSTTNGSLTMTTDKDVNLVLNNVTLTNPNGAAFNISGGKTTNILLTSGTTNTLSDGLASTKNGAITTNGPIIIQNSGSLKINGLVKHGINTSSTITILGGLTTITSAANDGFHSEGFSMSGGSITVLSSLGDGIDAGNSPVSISGGTLNITSTAADVKAIKTGTSTITISGGTITFTVSGAQSKGISAKGNISFTGGIINGTISGIAVFTASSSGYDPSYASAIKSDAAINIDGGTFNITINSSANGGKAFSAGTSINITNGTFVISTAGTGATYTNTTGVIDSYGSSCFSSDTDIIINGGTFTITVSGTGGKGMSADGNITINGAPNITINNSGTQFLISGTAGASTASYATAKCMKADGNITINSGTLVLTVTNQNSTCIDSDSIFTISGGTVGLTVGGNKSKAITAKGDAVLSGGNITINATGGIVLETSGSGYDPSYCAGIKSDTNVIFSGATVIISGSGTGFKGISSTGNINMTSGNISVSSSGSGTTYTGITGVTDSYSSAAFSADANILVTGGVLTTTSSGAGGKGLKADGGIIIGSTTGNPTLNITATGNRFLVSGTDYCHPKTIVAVGAITINNGINTISSKDDGIHSDTSITINGGNTTVTASSTTSGVGEGIESPLINITGGTTNVSASNDGLNGTYGTVSGGTESNDGSNINISGGILIVTGSDAIDANGNLTITGGTTIVCGPTSQPEEGIDFNGNFNMNGGILISGGSNTNMTKAMNTTSTQRGMYLKSSAQLAATSVLHIENASGTEMVTFKPKNAVYYFHFSSPNISASTSYKVYFGGSYTGGSFVGNSSGWGLYTGGTYSNSGATLKSTFTYPATGTVNTVSF